MGLEDVIAWPMKAGFELRAHGGLRLEGELDAGMMGVIGWKEIVASGKV